MDQNKKTLRSFQCRDYLWEIFGQMSAELESAAGQSERGLSRPRAAGAAPEIPLAEAQAPISRVSHLNGTASLEDRLEDFDERIALLESSQQLLQVRMKRLLRHMERLSADPDREA